MSQKKDILRNLNKYRAKEIADFIQEGIVSQEELQNDSGGQYTPFLKYMVEDALKKWAEEALPVDKVEEEIEDKISDKPYVDNAEKADKTFEIPNVEDIEVSQEEYNNISSAGMGSQSHDETTTKDSSSINVDGKKTMFKRLLSFSGRIRRTEYGLTILILYIIGFLFAYVIGNADDYPGDGVIVAYLFYYVIGTWILIAQSTKRCHDLGHSGWWQMIPFYGLWLLFDEGDGRMPNRYGESAK